MLIRPKAGILDPQGQAVERALPALGFGGVANVHVGDALEPERRQRALDGLPLRIEDSLLRPDEHPSSGHWRAPLRSSQASNGSPVIRWYASR